MKTKKILALIVAMMMVLSVSAVAYADAFKDVDEESHPWAIDAIEEMAEKGLIKGYSDGTFKPDNVISKLEALSLTARILGVQEPENELILNAAIDKYSETVDTYDLNFGSDEVCYLLMKDVLSVDELGEYLDAGNVSKGMKRYEIAVLLTKALDADDEVSKNLITTLEFDDADDIPSYAKKYVEYVTNNEIMSGTGNNNFSPEAPVTRAQIAILMNKLLDITGYSFKSGIVAEYDNSSRTIRIKSDDETIKYKVDQDVILRFEGTEITVNDIAGGYDAVITLKDDSLYAIDFVTPLIDKEVNGVVVSVSTGSKNSITIYPVNDYDVDVNSTIKETYPLSANVVVSYNDSSSSLKDVKSGSFVGLVVKKGEAVAVKAYDKTRTESGRVVGVEITPVCRISVELANGTVESYIVSNNVEVSRNGAKATAAEVVSGDSVSITTTYNRITKIVASGKKQEKAGLIHEVIISATPKITIKSTEGINTYHITNSCVLDLPGVTSPTFYDLRVGVAVELTLEGDTVTKLTANVSEGVTQVSGVVSSVNTSYSVIQVNYVDPTTGISVTEPVFVKSKAAIVDILTGNSIKLNAIKTGAKVTAFGLRTNGVFEATTINVTNN